MTTMIIPNPPTATGQDRTTANMQAFENFLNQDGPADITLPGGGTTPNLAKLWLTAMPYQEYATYAAALAALPDRPVARMLFGVTADEGNGGRFSMFMTQGTDLLWLPIAS